jgi:hypothetical protein
MTKGRGALPWRAVAGQKAFFITLGGQKAHDSSVEKHCPQWLNRLRKTLFLGQAEDTSPQRALSPAQNYGNKLGFRVCVRTLIIQPRRGDLNFRAVQISGVVNIAALISLDKRVLEPGTAKPGWVLTEG